MINERNIFLAGLMFYTRLPMPSWFVYQDGLLQQATKYLPLIGTLIGAAAAVVYGLAQYLLVDTLAVLLAMLTTILLTGALHEDGFADACDGFGGGWDQQQILRIMKDSRIGSYGAVGIVLILALKFHALLALSAYGDYLVMASLLVAHALSRFMAVTVMQCYDYVQAPQVSKVAAVSARVLQRRERLLALLLTGLPLVLLLSRPVLLLALVPVWLGRCWLARYFQRRIGGYTGDCLGAVQQVCEVLCYLSVLALCGFT